MRTIIEEKDIIQIKEEFEIPGTDFILEKGDKIKIIDNFLQKIIIEKMIISTFDDPSDAETFAKAYDNFLSYHRGNKVALSMDNKDIDKIKAELDKMGGKVKYIVS